MPTNDGVIGSNRERNFVKITSQAATPVTVKYKECILPLGDGND